MPRKTSKKSLKKKNSLKKKTLEFNVNLDQNPNGIIDPIQKSVNDEKKLAGLLNGMTQNSFNDGVDTTLQNAASLLNSQLNDVIGDNPGLFNQNTLEKMLKYVIEPTFNQLNEMANNTQYNYNQYGGVITDNQFNKFKNKGEQKGGFYGFPRFRQPSFMMPSVRRRSFIPRVSYNPRLIYPRTMIVPSYTIVTHDRIRALSDNRDRDNLNHFVRTYHSWGSGDSDLIVKNHPKIPADNKVETLENLGDNFYKIKVEGDGTDYLVYGLHISKKDDNRRYYFASPYYKVLDRIASNALYKSKNNSDKLKYIDNDKLVSEFGIQKNKTCKESADCSPIQEHKYGYYKSTGMSEYTRHVMLLKNVL